MDETPEKADEPMLSVSGLNQQDYFNGLIVKVRVKDQTELIVPFTSSEG